MTDTNSLEPSIYQIVFLRHGESVGNAEGTYQGRMDYDLTDTGRRQVQALVERWQAEKVTFDQIISSPLARARQTAEIIAGRLGLAPEFDPIWMERNAGGLEGLNHAEAVQRYPRPAFIDPYQPIGLTGESQWELYLRAGQALLNILRRPAGRYLIVSHGAILNMTMHAILGITPQANFQGVRFRFRNTAFASVTYNPAIHEWILQGVNDHAHWRFEDE